MKEIRVIFLVEDEAVKDAEALAEEFIAKLHKYPFVKGIGMRVSDPDPFREIKDFLQKIKRDE